MHGASSPRWLSAAEGVQIGNGIPGLQRIAVPASSIAKLCAAERGPTRYQGFQERLAPEFTTA